MFLLLPFLAQCQYIKSWKLYVHQKKALSVKGDSVRTMQLNKNDTSTLKFVFNEGDTAFKRKVIVMNSKRNSIDDKNITAKGCEVIFNAKKLYQQSEGEDITFYIIKIPADPAKAALVRVAPHPFFNLQWKE